MKLTLKMVKNIQKMSLSERNFVPKDILTEYDRIMQQVINSR